MVSSLLYWCNLYKNLRPALCIDIECCYFNGPISVISMYEPKDGIVEAQTFIRGKDLTYENLKQAFSGIKLLITYNGLFFDVPKIKKEYPGVLSSDIRIFDVYLFARKLGMNTGLKVLENTFRIERPEEVAGKQKVAIRLWKQYENYGDNQALSTLIEYNRQDAVNLYPLAEELVKRANSLA